ncbi:MAG: hypothetical protein WCX83_02970 [Candidatus Cloacimonas sp.]|nr:hypothetical protein [Candidatus Cloacimonadota bacterium]
MKKYYLLFLLFVVMFSMGVRDAYSEQVYDETAKEKALIDYSYEDSEYYQEYQAERDIVLELSRNGNRGEISSRFNSLASEIEESYLQLEMSFIRDKHDRMHYVYKDIQEVADQYYFYEALLNYLVGDIKTTRENLELLVEKYPFSRKMRHGTFLLQAIYVYEQENEMYVELFNKFPKFATPKNRFWLGQAYFNLAKYEESKLIMQDLVNNDKYGLRSQVILSMVDYIEGGQNNAINSLETIKQKFSPADKGYEVAVLSLARLYGLLGEHTLSLDSYNEYLQLLKGEPVSNEIIFEMGLVARDAGYVDLAKNYFSSNTNNSPSAHLFDRSLANIATIISEYDSVEDGMTLLEEAIMLNEANREAYQIERDALEEIKESLEAVIYTPTGANKGRLIRETRVNLVKFIELQNVRTLGAKDGIENSVAYRLQLMNEEFVSLVKLILQLEELVDKVGDKKEGSESYKVQRMLEDIENLRIRAYVLKIIGEENLPFDSSQGGRWQPIRYGTDTTLSRREKKERNQRYQLALDFAKRIVALEDEREEAVEVNDIDEIDRIDEEFANIEEDIEYTFGNIDLSDEFVGKVEEEQDKLSTVWHNLKKNKDKVVESYYQVIAKKLKDVNEIYYLEAHLANIYTGALYQSIQDSILKMDNEYSFSLLDVLFQEVLENDRELEDLIEQFEEEAVRGEEM